MEEVDRIIIHSLRDIGCAFDDELESLEDFTPEVVVEAVVRCLQVIQPGTDLPRSLPHNLAARFHIGSTIAETCQRLGYNGEVGYQTFLYSNVGEVRRVFMFLIEKLPRETEKLIFEPDDALSKLRSEIGSEVRRLLAARRAPPTSGQAPFSSVPLETGILPPGTRLATSPKEWREYVISELPFLTEQTTVERLLPSVITLAGRGLCRGGLKGKELTPSPSLNTLPSDTPPPPSWLTLNQALLFSRDVIQNKENSDVVEKTEGVDLSLDSLQINEEVKGTVEKEETPEDIRSNINNLNAKILETQEMIEKVGEECKREVRRGSEVSREVAVREKALSLLASWEESLPQLQQTLSALSDRILLLAGKWELYRKPLLEKYTAARSAMANKENQNEEEIDKIKQFKGKIEVLNKQLVVKRGIISQLEEEFEKLPKNINRSAYTRRIMEIIGNISKQKDQIEKILSDTKELQKEINSLNGRLERLFAVTEETIYRNARKDEFSKRTYKLLATLHSDCATIGSLVLEIGTITREITDLKEQIEVESRKNTTANLERITADLEQMRAESRSLKTQVTKLGMSSEVGSHPLS